MSASQLGRGPSWKLWVARVRLCAIFLRMSRDALLLRVAFAPLVLVAGAVAALAIVLFPASSSAQNTGSGGGGRQLEAGPNDIDWDGASVAPADLFNDIPRLDAIWIWDPDTGSWLMAGRDVPVSLWTLTEVQTGIGVTLVISEGDPVELPAPPPAIQGLVMDAEGASLADRRVLLHRVVDMAATGEGDQPQRPAGPPLESTTDEQGRFRFAAPEDGRYRLELFPRPGRECSVFYGGEQWASRSHAAELIQFAGENISGIDFEIEAGVCAGTLSVRILDAEGVPLSGATVRADMTGGSWFTGERPTDSDGAWAVTLSDGEYRLWFRTPDDCELHVSGNVATPNSGEADLIRIAGHDVHRDIRIPDGYCEYAISGTVRYANGEPARGLAVSTLTIDDDTFLPAITGGAIAGEDGSYTVVVPRPASYIIHLGWPDLNCGGFVRGDELLNFDTAEMFQVTAADIRRDIRIPAGTCEYSMSGTIMYEDGSVTGLSDSVTLILDSTIGESGPFALGGGIIAEDGSFTAYASRIGSYRLAVWFGLVNFTGQICVNYVSSGGLTDDPRQARTFTIGPEGEPRGVSIRIPADICPN